MKLRGVFRDAQRFGNFLVAHTFYQPTQHFRLPRGQIRTWAVRRQTPGDIRQNILLARADGLDGPRQFPAQNALEQVPAGPGLECPAQKKTIQLVIPAELYPMIRLYRSFISEKLFRKGS